MVRHAKTRSPIKRPQATVTPQILINLATLDAAGNVSVQGLVLGGTIVVTTDLSCALYQMPNTANPILLTNGATPGMPATNWSFAFNNTGLNAPVNLLAMVYQTSKPAISGQAPVTDL